MRPGFAKVHLAPYGTAQTAVKELADLDTPYRKWLRTVLRRPSGHVGHLDQIWVASVRDLNPDFVKIFREHSVPEARLLLMNSLTDRLPTDFLLSHLLALQIRSAHRMYVADCLGADPEQLRNVLGGLFQRLAASSQADHGSDRIFDVKILDGVLHVISSNFNRIEVPLARISSLADKDPVALMEYQIDEDGAFIFWPEFDVHIGWDQLRQIVDPAAALKAKQRHDEFNVRYGKALRLLREKSGLALDAIPGLSEKQLRRIEKGECRLTSNAVDALANAFHVPPDKLLSLLANSLSRVA